MRLRDRIALVLQKAYLDSPHGGLDAWYAEADAVIADLNLQTRRINGLEWIICVPLHGVDNSRFTFWLGAEGE